MIRREALDQLGRWREVFLAWVIICVGIWMAWVTFGLTRWLGYGLCLTGGVYLVAAIQRVRFQGAGAGSGVVQLRERELSYFGPNNGGVVSLDDVHSVALVSEGHSKFWVLEAGNTTRLRIPTDARDVTQLFDAFMELRGIKMEKVLSALEQNRERHIYVWTRPPTSDDGVVLH
jgi:hypothetical protein